MVEPLSSVFSLGLYALSSIVKKNRDADTLKKTTAAAAVKTQADQAFELKKQELQSQLNIQEERAKNQPMALIGIPGQPDSVATKPLNTPHRLPKDYQILAVRTGSSTNFTATSDAGRAMLVGSGQAVYAYKGEVGTREYLNNKFNTSPFLNPPPLDLGIQVGVTDQNAMPKIFDTDTAARIAGATNQKQIRVGDNLYSLGQEPQARADAADTGNAMVLMQQLVGRSGRVFGETKESPMPDATTTERTVRTLIIPATGKKKGVTIPNLNPEDFDAMLAKHNVAAEDVIVEERKIVSAGETILSNTLVSRSVPVDVEETRESFTAIIDGVVYSNLSLIQLKKTANDAGYDLSQIEYTSQTTTTKNGDVVSTTYGETSKAEGVVRHIAYVAGQDGNPIPIQGDSPSQLDKNFGHLPGYKYEGTATTLNQKIVGVVTPAVTEDIQLTLPSGQTVLNSEATAEQKENAVSQTMVKVSTDGTIEPTSASSLTTGQSMRDSLNMPMRAANGKHLGGFKSDSPAEQLSTMNARLTPDVIESLNSGEGAAEYIRQTLSIFAQASRNILSQDATNRAEAGFSPMFRDASVLKYIRDNGLSSILQVKGMRKALMEADFVNVSKTAEEALRTNADTTPPGALALTTPAPVGETDSNTDRAITTQDFSGVDTVQVSTYVPAQNAKFASTVLLPTLASLNGGNKGAAEAKMFAIVQVERNWDGLPVIDSENRETPSVNQAPLVGLERLHGIKGADNKTMLDRFIRFANGEGVRSIDDIRAFSSILIPSVPNLVDGVELTKAFIYQTPYQGISQETYFPTSVLEAMREQGMGTTQGEKSFRASLGVIRSGERGIGIANSLLATYFDEKNQIRISSAVANFDLSLDGLKYMSREVSSRLGGLFGGGNDAVASIVSEVTSQLDTFKAGIELRTGVGDDGVSGNTGRDQIEAIITEIATDVSNAKNQQDAALAARQFYLVTLAYEISAAIQGGTGGRTISDQDVALILGALRQNFLATPEAQVSTIRAARGMMQDITQRARYETSSEPMTLAAYNVWMSLATASDANYADVTPESVAARLGGVSGANNYDDEQILNTMNADRALTGKEPLTELTPELRTTFQRMMGI